MVKWLVQFVLPLAVAAAALGLVVALGYATRPPEPAGPVGFADIVCEAPPGMTREAFLLDVQSRENLPNEVDPADERVRAAFRAHPWVKLVGPLERRGGGVSVALEFRRPVLLVAAWGRAVDEGGVLLPVIADTSALIVDRTKRGPPRVKQGERSAEVAELAAVAAALPPAEELRGASVELAGGDVTLRGARFALRLRKGTEDRLVVPGPLAGFEWDLRDGVKKKPLR